MSLLLRGDQVGAGYVVDGDAHLRSSPFKSLSRSTFSYRRTVPLKMDGRTIAFTFEEMKAVPNRTGVSGGPGTAEQWAPCEPWTS
jgi:hypothetical protein